MGGGEEIAAALEPAFAALAAGDEEVEAGERGVGAAEGNFELEGPQVKREYGADLRDGFVQ